MFPSVLQLKNRTFWNLPSFLRYYSVIFGILRICRRLGRNREGYRKQEGYFLLSLYYSLFLGQDMTEKDSLATNVIASSAAGLISRFICHPIDTLKVRYHLEYKLPLAHLWQTQSRIQAPIVATAEFRGLWAAAKTTVFRDGIKGFYRGIGAVLVGGIPATSLYLTSYEVFFMKKIFLS